MNSTIKTIIKRKSTRAFQNKEISKEIQDLIIESAINAPTAGNMQLYSIIKVDKKALLKKLAKLCDNQPFIETCGMCLIFVADYSKWQRMFKAFDLKPRNIQEGDLLLAIEDAMAAAQNSVIAAESLGISSCYIGDIMENYEEVVKLLKLPSLTYPCSMLVFGYPDPKVKNLKKPKRFNKKYIVFENKYKTLSNRDLKEMIQERAKPKADDWLKAFMIRKHNSDFSREMQRSAKLYIKNFKNNG